MLNNDVLTQVFEGFVNNAKIFKNREVLRHEYIPEQLPRREEQIRQLGETIAPVLKNNRCSNIFIYGKNGTGKTAVTKHVLSHLEYIAKKFNAPVKYCYVNCQLVGSEYRVLASLCENIGVHVPFTGLSIGEVFDRFKKGLDKFKIILIIVLDEIDILIKNVNQNRILYDITRINEFLYNSKTCFLGISNDLRLKEFLDPQILSTLSEEELVFKPYNAKDLKIILSDRAHLGFYADVLTEGALNYCSALAANEHGDARRALDLLRVAGEVAERKGDNQIVEKHVLEAEKRIEHNRVIDALKNLTLHSKLVFLSIFHLKKHNSNTFITGTIYECYTKLCDELCITPLTHRRISTLLNELETLGLITAKIMSMGRYGRTKKIKLNISQSLVKNAFIDDVRLSFLLNLTISSS